MGTMITRFTFLIPALVALTTAQNVFVASPKVVRLGVETTIAIAVDGTTNPQHFEIYIEDHPGYRKNITHVYYTVNPASPEVIPLLVRPSDVPDIRFSDSSVKHYVSLTVHSTTFHKKILLPISHRAGYVFLQTDKPIYTAEEIVQFRIIPLNEDGTPASEKIKFQIRNPKNIVVLETELNEKPFITPEPYKFPSYALLGLWSANVLYGHQFLQNSSVQFELQEYVLPTFVVKLDTQDVILPSDEEIQIAVEAKYVYGKPVEGFVSLKLGVKGEAPEAKFFTILDLLKLDNGIYKTTVPTSQLKNHKNIGWFPQIEGFRFVVEATVTDDATGQKEVVLDSSSHFSSSPFIVSFKNCPNVFKPGLVSVIQADINFVDGRPAPFIRTSISATADGIPLKITNTISLSDENGKVLFEVHPEIHHKELNVTVQTDDPRYELAQSVGHHLQYNFKSVNKAYLAITRSNKELPEPGKFFTELIYFEPENITDMYFMVISKGKILLINRLHGRFKLQNMNFLVTHEMVPSFRIVAFADYRNELIADSIRVDVAKTCDPKADVTLETNFGVQEPASTGKIIISGPVATKVGLLAVDSAVYALSDKGQLTKSKMFKTMEDHDLGCGPGGGLTTNSVLRDAGIVMTTNNYSPPPDATVSACEETLRRKRSIINEKVKEYEGRQRYCCALGMNHDSYKRTCLSRAQIVEEHLGDKNENCSQVFLDCCLHGTLHDSSGLKLKDKGLTSFQTARIGNFGNNLEFISIEDEEHFEIGARTEFRETWFFTDFDIGPDGKEDFRVSLPHSITTWVIQAVSLSPANGMCIAEPLKLVSFKKIFLQLNLPFAVVKNEQIEVQATVFNYGDSNLASVVYMYGAKDLCTGMEPGQKSERKRIVVPPHSAQTVFFPIVPLAVGVYDIKVTALAADGSDVIIRKLNVVAEGETIEQEISIMLDPSNQQKRSKRHITTEAFSDSIVDSQNLQVTAIDLKLPDDYIHGTESCIISAAGDLFGPTVQTALENPDVLINKPHGCAEQAMIYLAPTVYTMKYLKANNKISAAIEAKGYDFIRQGYDLMLTYRKDDGSYGAWSSTPSSTWLTAYIIKVFCQARQLVYINEEVICSGIKWLITKQTGDGSFIEHHPIYHVEMMGGVQGQTPLTAFVLITLQECSCDIPNLDIIKARAMSYLEDHLGDLSEPLPVAIASYALALSDSEFTQATESKLMTLSTFDEDRNMLYWQTGSSAYSVEATSYALLTELLLVKMDKCNSIVNWLNTQRMATGAFQSTQDTVVALQALSEYSIRANTPELKLMSNITSSNDRHLHETFQFNEKNARILQEHRVDKLGGMLFVNTAGHGVGLLSVKLRYNVPRPKEITCKFEVVVNLTEEKELPDIVNRNNNGGVDIGAYPEDLIRVEEALALPPYKIELAVDPRNRHQNSDNQKRSRVKREDNNENSNEMMRVRICIKYLGDKDPGMTIIEAGIFSGYKAKEEDLKELVANPEHEVDRYELTIRGVVFYLRKVPLEEQYCLSFRIISQYTIGKTQSSLVKVYAYYNPEDSCSIFYSPSRNSPLLRKICNKNNDICQCAEGGCPSKRPFSTTGIGRDNLKKTACEDHDYVWIVQALKPAEKLNGFLNMELKVIEVLKEGIEKESLVEKEVRSFLARDDCDKADLNPNSKYLIMGKDGKQTQNDKGEIGYQYLLDKTSKIHYWVDKPSQQGVMRALQRLRVDLESGCDL